MYEYTQKKFVMARVIKFLAFGRAWRSNAVVPGGSLGAVISEPIPIESPETAISFVYSRPNLGQPHRVTYRPFWQVT
jgi:hypothetical protein